MIEGVGALTSLQIAKIGLSLAQGLSQIHGRGASHGDIKPTNVAFRDKELTQAVILDFGQSRFSDTAILRRQIDTQKATLPYLPPEMSGFLGDVDVVSCDLYSLGVTLYQCAVGEVPFIDQEPKAIIRRILTEVPPSVSVIVPEFPEALSEIIAKLMRKQPVDRYQTAIGLAADLEFCLNALKREKIPRIFALGRKDKIRELNYRIPMIGRREEIERLRNHLNCAHAGRGGVAFIAAPSGTGKSRLSLEFAAEARTLGIETLFTKFSEFERNLPLSAFHSLFHDFAYRLSQLSPQNLRLWQNNVLQQLQAPGQLVSERFTELAPYLPKFPPLPRMEHDETSRVFLGALARFLCLSNWDGSGQVIILDDLQWADSSSLELVAKLLEISEDTGLGKTMVVGTYRSNEVTQDHPFMTRVLVATHKEQRIELGPLSEEESQTLIEAIIDERSSEIDKLVKFTYGLTQGNPFFSYECLKSLISSEAFAPNEEGVWIFHEKRRTSSAISSGMAELVSDRIRKLPQLEQESIIIASVVGSKFPLHILSRLVEEKILKATPNTNNNDINKYGGEKPDVIVRLVQSQLVSHHLILPDEINFIFFHDKVREAAIALASEDLKSSIHQICGEYLGKECLELEEKQSGGAASQHLYDAAFHLMRGHPSSSKTLARRILLLAAQRSVQVFAFQKALDYLEVASSLFQVNSKIGIEDEDKAEWIAINELMACALGLSRRIVEAVDLLDNIYELVDDPLHKAKICVKRVDYNCSLFRYRQCIQAAKDGLQQLECHPCDSELHSVLIILFWTPWLAILCLWFWVFGKQKKVELSAKDEIRLKLLLAYQVPTYLSQPLIAIAQQILLIRELMFHEDNYFRVVTIGYWGVVTANLGLPKVSQRCFNFALNYFEKNPDPLAQGFLLFQQSYQLDCVMGNFTRAQANLEKALEILSGVGESFYQSLTLLAIIQLDYFGLESNKAIPTISKLIGLWEQVEWVQSDYYDGGTTCSKSKIKPS